MKEGRPISDRTTSMGMFLVRMIPGWLGPSFAMWAGRIFARLRPGERAIVESNLSVVLGADNQGRLRKFAIKALGHAALAYYELYRLPALSREKIVDMVQIDEPGWTQFKEAHSRGKGIIIVSPHLSSYDLGGQALVARGFPICALVLPNQVEGMAFANWKRTFQGTKVLSLGAAALREIMRYLRAGGVIVTGGERPVKGQGIEVEFFGRPTILPDGLARLAMRTGAALIGAACRREKGSYRIGLQRIELARSGDNEADVRENTQRLARFMESAIRLHPEQWHLLLRLWAEE
jgi:lauroyl/myristoyl acyltransferase